MKKKYLVHGHIPVVFETYACSPEEAIDNIESEQIHTYDLSKHLNGMLEINTAEESTEILVALSIVVRIDEGHAEQFVYEFLNLAQDGDVSLDGIQILQHETTVDFVMAPETLTDAINDIIGHAAYLFRYYVHEPKQL